LTAKGGRERLACYLVRVAKLLGGCLVAFLTLAGSVRADLPPEVSIRWSGACPRPFGLEAEVSQLLGGKRPQLAATAFEVEVDAEREGYELTLEVESAGTKAERTVRLPSCREAQDAAVLLIATAIDPDAVLRVQTPPPPPPPPTPPAPVLPKQKVPAHRWSLWLRGLFDLQSLPGPTLGPTVGGLYQDAHWRAWADLRYLPARTARAGEADARARVDLFAAALGGSYAWAWGPFVFGPALEVEAGVLRARDVRGLTSSENASSPWGSVQLGGLAGWGATRRLGLELGLFAGVPMRRPALSAGGLPRFYETEPVTMRLALAVRVSLGSP
jgi:hypothetical protein